MGRIDVLPKFGGLAVVLVAMLALSGCGESNQFAAFNPQFLPAANARVAVGPVADKADPIKRTNIPADFSPAAELKSQLEQKLASAGFAVSPDSGAITILPTITDYDPGNAGLRWLAPGAGATVLTVKCDVQQNGATVGTINVRRTIEVGGLYTIGQWKLIFGTVADDIVDELKKKAAQGK